jgi:hypothetical protein
MGGIGLRCGDGYRPFFMLLFYKLFNSIHIADFKHSRAPEPFGHPFLFLKAAITISFFVRF